MIDEYYAKALCKIVKMKGGDLVILFVRQEDKNELINTVFKKEKKKYTQVYKVNLKIRISQGTQLYAWGNASEGKLGLANHIKSL
mmetsp:Transcript_26050/g.25265  ORF Transcript_26050/g.25265 Transcript_26050/m.25265 type:complete len:85 (-) Transcript_26050:156-410(-)|eukprot:CAMPEP_0170567886 /NCGR_PEP_ID=MMETSP0211-20121228/80773_1 /TAXON_ID=311385 /ORGANISM="Pseudokeronopsis sp., Strain OXSARD2" /LENGTH=84 /DNA_ID=CAMNT_0010889479 /DNA_START=273 /DNA_END=527 /DNA_ORIENTATION=-